MTFARRLGVALTLTVAGAAGTYGWVASGIDRACRWRSLDWSADPLASDTSPRCLP